MKKDKSVLISMVFLGVFLMMLIAADVFSWQLCGEVVKRSQYLLKMSGTPERNRILMMSSLYTCSIPAYIAIFFMFRLLKNILGNEIFIEVNVKCLRWTCWCLTAACLITLASTLYYPLFLFIAAACGFMALIVHIVKNVMERAVSMKSELDLTI